MAGMQFDRTPDHRASQSRCTELDTLHTAIQAVTDRAPQLTPRCNALRDILQQEIHFKGHPVREVVARLAISDRLLLRQAIVRAPNDGSSHALRLQAFQGLVDDTIAPAWIQPKVISAAKAVLVSGSFSTMPEVARALNDAGCRTKDVLQMCLSPIASDRSQILARLVFNFGSPSAARVNCKLPAGESYCSVALALHRCCTEAQPDTPALGSSALRKLGNYIAPAGVDLRQEILGFVDGSAGLPRWPQRNALTKLGATVPTFETIVLAHLLYYMTSGEDLFQGHMVRTKDSILGFDSTGLEVRLDPIGQGFQVVGSAAAFPVAVV